jgi:hypothetical protein
LSETITLAYFDIFFVKEKNLIRLSPGHGVQQVGRSGQHHPPRAAPGKGNSDGERQDDHLETS